MAGSFLEFIASTILLRNTAGDEREVQKHVPTSALRRPRYAREDVKVLVLRAISPLMLSATAQMASIFSRVASGTCLMEAVAFVSLPAVPVSKERANLLSLS